MSWATVAVAGASLVGGMMGSSSAKKGARAQAAAIREATALQRHMYNTTRNDLSQYRDVGGNYLGQLDRSMPELTKSFSMSDFVKDPGYDFRMQEGQKALERSASARGGLMGGAAGKALARYGQDYASNEYQNAYNRFNADRDQRFNKLSQLVGMGHNAAAQTGQAAQNYGNQAAQNIIGGGNAQAASAIASGNAWSNAIGQGLGAYAATGGFGGSGSQNNMTKLVAGETVQSQPTSFIRFSDRRLKKNIVRLKTSLFKDVPTYCFEYINTPTGPQIGVMAQDLLEVNPNHPAVIKDGEFYKVNYSLLEAA